MFDGEVGSLNKRKVSLRGKSGREDSAKDTIDKARKERAFRKVEQQAVERKQNDSATTLQSWYRGRSVTFRARIQCRNDLVSKLHDLQRVEAAMALAKGDSNFIVPHTILTRLIRQTIFIFEANSNNDAATVSVICKRLLQSPRVLENVMDAAGQLRMRRLACICLLLVANQGSKNSVLEVLRELCTSEVVAKPVRVSVLEGLGKGEGMVIRCGPPHSQLIQPNLLKYVVTSKHLNLRSFSVLCNCALTLLRELGEEEKIATQVSQILLPAEELMQPGSRLYANLTSHMVNHPWANSAWLSALSCIDSSFLSNVGLTAGTYALVNVLKLHQMLTTGLSNNTNDESIWACVSHLVHPEIFLLFAADESSQEMNVDGNNDSEDEFYELENEERLELRYIIRQKQKLSRAMITTNSFSNKVYAPAVEALYSLTNPTEVLRQLDSTLPSVPFAPDSVQKAPGYSSIPGSLEASSLNDGALSICAVYGELVAWGDPVIDIISNRRVVVQQQEQHSSFEGGLHQNIRQMISALAYSRSKNSIVSRLWWHLKNRWRVDMVISKNTDTVTMNHKYAGHGSLNVKQVPCTTSSQNMITTHISKLVSVLLLFCDTYHLQLLGLDDQDFFEKGLPLPIEEVRSVIEFLRNWLLKVCWDSPLLISNVPPSHVELHLFESAVSLYNALHDRWSRRPYAKPEMWNWPALSSALLFPFPRESNPTLSEIRSFYFGGSRPLPVILVNIPQVIPFNQRLLIFRSLIKGNRRNREEANMLAQQRGSGRNQNRSFRRHSSQRQMDGRPSNTLERFFGTPNTTPELPDTMGLLQEDIVSPFLPPKVLRIRRNELYKDSLEGLVDIDIQDHFRIEMVNEHGVVEPGIDGGGVFKEWMDDLTKSAFSSKYGLWMETCERLLFPNPTASNRLGEYVFCGLILGKAVLDGILIETLFSLPFLNSLLDRQNSIDELYTLDSSIYGSLMELKSYAAADGNNVRDLCLTFSVDRPMIQEEEHYSENQEVKQGGVGSTTISYHVNRMRTVDLIPNGREIEVTNENVSYYIHCMGHFILNVECRDQCRAFISGFREELQRLIGGDFLNGLDVNDLMENTIYAGGYHPSQPYIQAFWDFVKNMDPNDQAALLQFVTSCSRQPLLGFKELNPRFCIQKVLKYSDEDPEGSAERLPTSSTCVNLLKLPQYDNIETMRSKLSYSIHSCGGFELT